jgi:hypothetical protein
MTRRRFTMVLSLLLVVASVPLMMGQGCINPPPANQNPQANAGADQTVGFGTTVTLNGSASTDPDGDALTFSWTQMGGTNSVTLSNASASVTTFTAPNAADTLVFQLSVDDGNGGTDTDTAVVTVQAATPTVTPTLYIANFVGNNVTAYDITNPNAINGNIAPDANLAGASTLLSSPSDIIIDSGGGLLASNFTMNSVTGYANAADLSGINGNVAPTRNVQGAATLLTQPVSLAVNTSSDLAFVALTTGGTVHVYANASTAAFNGNLAPTRTITTADFVDPRGINFGAGDTLYVAATTSNNVTAFASASTLNGAVSATRIITSAAFANLFDVFIDNADRMYVVAAVPTNQILVFNNASTLSGLRAPDVTLTVQGAVNLTAIAVDSTGVGYIVDAGANAVYSYDNVATRNGTLPPDRTLQGAQTQLSTPIRVFLQE